MIKIKFIIQLKINNAQLAATLDQTQSEYCEFLAATDTLLGPSHWSTVNEWAPYEYHLPLTKQLSGPPESPLQTAAPLSPKHIIPVLIIEPYFDRH